MPRRVVLCLGLALALGGAAAHATHAAGRGAGPSSEPTAWARDPVSVFYGSADCRGSEIELQVWDREARSWKPHPAHPRVSVPSCRVEDAGVLLNELRWRCVEPPDSDPPPPWIVGLGIFDPEVMSRCAVDQIGAGERRTTISVVSPGEGSPVLAPEPVVPILGSVRVDGLEGSDYDVVLVLDRSAAAARGPDPLAVQLAAARAFARRLAPRLRTGAVQMALVSYPNLPPGPGESTGARRELGLTGDPAAVDAALARLPRRHVDPLSTLPAALELALDELALGRSSARRVIVVGFDGRELPDSSAASSEADARLRAAAQRAAARGVVLHWFALGGLAEGPPAAVQGALELARGSFTRVLPAALTPDFLASVQLPVAEEVWIESRTRGGAPVRGRVDAAGRFQARIPVDPGENELLIRARTSDGGEASRRFELVFDDSLILERVLEAERARIHRAQRKRLELEPEQNAAP